MDILTGLIETTKLIVTGVIGGFIGGWISFRFFMAQKRYEIKLEDQIKRREALRDMASTLTWIPGDILFDWEKPINEKQTPQEYKMELVNKITYWKTLFWNDPKLSNVLEKFSGLLGADTLFNEDEEIRKSPHELIDEIRISVKEKLIEVEKSIT